MDDYDTLKSMLEVNLNALRTVQRERVAYLEHAAEIQRLMRLMSEIAYADPGLQPTCNKENACPPKQRK